MTVSVITCHISGREEFLLEAYRSLQSQEEVQWEWIVQCDEDCRVEDFRDSRVSVFLNKKNMEISSKRNRALLNASGQFIATLDDDDLLPPGSLKRRLLALEKERKATFSFGAHSYLNGSKRPAPYRPGVVPKGEIFKEWLSRQERGIRNVTPAPANVMWRRGALWELGGWAALPRAGDTALLMRASILRLSVFVPEVTYIVREHPKRTSKASPEEENWQWVKEATEVLLRDD